VLGRGILLFFCIRRFRSEEYQGYCRQCIQVSTFLAFTGMNQHDRDLKTSDFIDPLNKKQFN
jgi:hypothetical protein